ncbi:MAG: aminotransferase class V-fold PLP-dependent enzyme [Gammaproteobacteria bacterium]
MNAAAIRAGIPLLSRNPVHYLDNAATSLMPREVIRAAAAYDSRARANVGRGVYAWAEDATAEYEKARAATAAALGAAADEIVFCGGATAALNMIAAGVCESMNENDSVWLAADNHHSNIIPWQIAAARRGFALRRLPAKPSGAVDLPAAQKMFAAARGNIKAVAVSHASNVSGEITNLPRLAEIAKSRGAILVADGAQYAPHGMPDMKKLGADFYAFSGHKCYAPNGIGVLWGRKTLLDSIPPPCGGGGMAAHASMEEFTCRPAPHKWEAGTPPISQAVAFAAALKWMQKKNISAARVETRALAKELREGLAKMPGVRMLGVADGAPIVSFCANAHPHDICQILAMHNVAARGGHHCAQPLMRHWNINGCTRFSIAPYNTAEDIEAALAAAARALKILQ